MLLGDSALADLPLGGEGGPETPPVATIAFTGLATPDEMNAPAAGIVLSGPEGNYASGLWPGELFAPVKSIVLTGLLGRDATGLTAGVAASITFSALLGTTINVSAPPCAVITTTGLVPLAMSGGATPPVAEIAFSALLPDSFVGSALDVAEITLTGLLPSTVSGVVALDVVNIVFTANLPSTVVLVDAPIGSIGLSAAIPAPAVLIRPPIGLIWLVANAPTEQLEAAQGTIVVLNANTLAVTEYSLSALDVVEHEGEVWFVTATGLNKLDSTAPLDAVGYVRTGKISPAPGSVTGVRFAHASIASTGPVELLVRRDDDGIERTDRYPIPIVPSGQPRERTIPLGKGAQASAWEFEFRASVATTKWSLGGLQIQIPLKKHRL